MSSAAWRAAPIARMTVAAPVTMSPPAQTFSTLVRPDGTTFWIERSTEANAAAARREQMQRQF